MEQVMKVNMLFALQGNTAPELVANGRTVMKKANGRLQPLLLGICVFWNFTALSVLSSGVVVRVFRDALDHCTASQNP